MQGLATAIVLPLGMGFALSSDHIVRIAMGEKWLLAVFLIQVLASVFALQTIGSLAQPLAMACGATKLLFRRDMHAFAMRVPSIIVGAYLAGFDGIVYARVIPNWYQYTSIF